MREFVEIFSGTTMVAAFKSVQREHRSRKLKARRVSHPSAAFVVTYDRPLIEEKTSIRTTNIFFTFYDERKTRSPSLRRLA